MLIKEPHAVKREAKIIEISSDLTVIGGGIAGVCAAVSAARQGLKVVLIQDRPVLGGNASSEVRLWVLGATAHMYSNNRWAREPGIVNEILLENLYRNPEGNAVVFDLVLLDLVTREPNITLLLNTAMFECTKCVDQPERIAAVRAFCSQNSTMYQVSASLFCDASGDGILGFTAGAAFRMGAEDADEFGEGIAPNESYGSLLGHSMYFYSRDAGRPVRFVPPAFALTPEEFESKIPRYRQFSPANNGCQHWWIEFGGRLDTIHETEKIKWELWRVVYGVWNYFKNSGKFANTENLTLEWASVIPGKRESRRFEGDFMLRQQDVIQATTHADDVAYGGWALDLHPADGVYSPFGGCTHWRFKGIYPIPYRCLYSKNIPNLFLAGRIISVSHAAFGSTRVQGTLGLCAQAVGVAAAVCRRDGLLPRDLLLHHHLQNFRRQLLRTGQHIPSIALEDNDDLARQATIKASSQLQLRRLPSDDANLQLDRSIGQLLPMSTGSMPRLTFTLDASQDTRVRFELRTCSRLDHHTPDITLGIVERQVLAGLGQKVEVDFACVIDEPRYVLACVMANPAVKIHRTHQCVTGLVALNYSYTQDAQKSQATEEFFKSTAGKHRRNPGLDSFEIWTPSRRPAPQNLTLEITPPIQGFDANQVTNGICRPTRRANAWVAQLDDSQPILTLQWSAPVTIGCIILSFDPDWEHGMESVLMGHPENAMPQCVKRYVIRDDQGKIIHSCEENHQARNEIYFKKPIKTSSLAVEILEMNGSAPAAIFEVRCYADAPNHWDRQT